jgi:hypothetical protein
MVTNDNIIESLTSHQEGKKPAQATKPDKPSTAKTVDVFTSTKHYQGRHKTGILPAQAQGVKAKPDKPSRGKKKQGS